MITFREDRMKAAAVFVKPKNLSEDYLVIPINRRFALPNKLHCKKYIMLLNN